MGKKDKPFFVRNPGLPISAESIFPWQKSGQSSATPTNKDGCCKHCGVELEERVLTATIGWGGEANIKGQVCPNGCDLKVQRGLLNY